jgi:aconitate hydratase
VPENATRKIIAAHLLAGEMRPGSEIALRVDQTLTQDATGTLVMLELEAMNLDRVRTELSAQYVDHNMLQQDFKNADDHRFLMSACARYGIWFSPAGNGVSHPVHQERFGIPGKTLLGSDSHTPAAGGIGMLAIGAGGLEVALAMSGEPFHVKMPEVWGVELQGELPDWVSAKDVILEMLRRHGVDGARGRVIEYYGPGVETLGAMDRHVIANMGTELGATSTLFPSDDEVRRFLRSQGREDDWIELAADRGAGYDHRETIDLSKLQPLIALPSSPGRVVPVEEVAGREIHQAYVGSSANPGYRDFAVAAGIVRGRRVCPDVSFDVNPTSRQILANLVRDGHLLALVEAGARIHQAGCNGCIGMGQAPATGTISLRTVPRNFPGRSGTREDQVYLCSPETAAASALSGRITDPRTLDMEPPDAEEPEQPLIERELLVPPPAASASKKIELVKGPNIVSIPQFEPLPDDLAVPVLLKVGDDLSTDEILPAGARVLPFRSNVPRIAEFAFDGVDQGYAERARSEERGHAIVAGHNYGQGSSREHAALAPRYLGLRVVIAKSFARIHWQNLVNFGVLPLIIATRDYDSLEPGTELTFSELPRSLAGGEEIGCSVAGGRRLTLRHELSSRQIDVLRRGGLINYTRERLESGD